MMNRNRPRLSVLGYIIDSIGHQIARDNHLQQYESNA